MVTQHAFAGVHLFTACQIKGHWLRGLDQGHVFVPTVANINPSYPAGEQVKKQKVSSSLHLGALSPSASLLRAVTWHRSRRLPPRPQMGSTTWWLSAKLLYGGFGAEELTEPGGSGLGSGLGWIFEFLSKPLCWDLLVLLR